MNPNTGEIKTLNMAIPEVKLGFEFDGEFHHKNKYPGNEATKSKAMSILSKQWLSLTNE